MRVLVCGSRHFKDYELLKKVLDDYSNISEIIHGGARGADTYAGRYGKETGRPVRVFNALWDVYGRSAGPIRNCEMLEQGKPDLVVAFLAPDSRGTKHMIEIAKKAGVEVRICEIS